jgi:class 3 adenylate cyclase
VFTLLETIYAAFDEIAKKRRVFKVETVGDCYVAVAGLPDPRHDHAVVMARFARDCLARMRVLTRKLEVTLGPDTADLSIRVVSLLKVRIALADCFFCSTCYRVSVIRAFIRGQ